MWLSFWVCWKGLLSSCMLVSGNNFIGVVNGCVVFLDILVCVVWR